MPWVKIPKENHAVFEAALPLDDRITVKAMFGGLAAMLRGQMMGGLFGTSAIVRLSDADQAALIALGGKPFDPMENGRVMSQTLVLPQGEFDDRDKLRAWLHKAHAHVGSLPVKPPKKASAKKAATKGPMPVSAAPKKVAKKVPKSR